MDVAIVGTGYVGLVTGACLADIGHHVACTDVDAEKIRVLESGGIPFYEPGLEELVTRNRQAGRLRFSTDTAGAVGGAEVVFIAVGTPPDRGGRADLSGVEKVCRDIARGLSKFTVIVEKSTVPVMTGEKVRRTIEREVAPGVPFEVASNPEFLREGNAIQDFLHPDRIVIGVAGEQAASILRRLYAPLAAPMIETDIASAELIK
ncbi:MAG: UDP-glucose/GDP-mannose dehydrogenase family protein, partial [Planctomycetes bacterium]|nr:UDP-glucose/GDP-mannose dehydrogenase family protein [Planctomycetota bacterium]